MSRNSIGLCCLVLWLSPRALHSQTAYRDTLRILWWNVENAFDTLDDPETKDEEFTPSGRKRWNTPRYHRKLNLLAKGIRSACMGRVPDFIGLCEIENTQVLDDLILRLPWEWDLWACHQDSPDLRGIDVAVLYNHEAWRLDSLEFIPAGMDQPSRDAIWTRFNPVTDAHGWPIDLLWMHLPSLRQPDERIRKAVLDHALAERTVDLLLGDLNSHPDGPLGVWMVAQGFQRVPGRGNWGTYAFGSKWSFLDHGWLSTRTSLAGRMEPIPFGISTKTARIPSIKPTFYAGNYYGGASDHLPVMYHIWNTGALPYIYTSITTR